MKHKAATLVIIFSATLWSHVSLAETKIGTWNLEHLRVRPTKDFQAIAKVAKTVDFLAIQELMNEDALAALAGELTKQTGQHWSFLASHSVGSTSYKEMYGFVWRDAAIRYEDGAVTYLDRSNAFVRDPFSARFHSLADGTDYVAATVHILYGKSQADRSSEITALSEYWSWLQNTYQDTTQILLMGDFNTPPSSTAWAPLESFAKPLMLKGASTLSTRDGEFSNLYDNVFVARDSRIKVNGIEVFDYPKYLNLSHAAGRSSVSDHAPIFLKADLNPEGSTTSSTGTSGPNRQPNDQTQSSKSLPRVGQLIVGNRESKIYHRPDCPSYNSVSSTNRIEFQTEQEAKAEHYRIARNCPKS